MPTNQVDQILSDTIKNNIHRIATLKTVNPDILRSLTLHRDARKLTNDSSTSEDVDLVITSPPYIGAQKYIRASSLSIGWLGLAPDDRLRSLELHSIGREHFHRKEYSHPEFPSNGLARKALSRIRTANPLRAHIASKYLCEMRDAISMTAKRLKHNKTMVLIIGNNTVAGKPFTTSTYIRKIAISLGLRLELELLDDIRSRGLMTKRNTTAALITREHIQVYRKS